ncbi:MAG: HAD-IC family P-type ATPase, partial [Candidatus Babeliales bacterium]
MKWYQESTEDVIKYLGTDQLQGLTSDQVEKRRMHDGENILPDVEVTTLWSIFLSQFQNPLIYILLIAAVIIFIVSDDKRDAFIISGVLLFNAILGTIQEGRTRNIIESLKRFIKTESIVLRNGKKVVIDDKDLVIGDIIFLQEGGRVPADARLIMSNNLQVDESVLTGESESERKKIEAINKEIPFADQTNMLFKGTYVLGGSGSAVVVEIGAHTEIGKIQRAVETIETAIPLKKEVDRLSYWILIFILCICVFLFIIGIFTGKPIKELLVVLTALFICVIPEGLPVVLTLVLVSGAYRMAKQSVLVKNMQAVEALGRTDVIVIDKTGTLTRNELMVSNVFADDTLWQVDGQGYHAKGKIQPHNGTKASIEQGSDLMQMGTAALLLNSAEITYQPKLNLFDIKGDPTEAAMFIFSKKLGFSEQQLYKDYQKIYEIPFDPLLRYHAGFYKKGSEYFTYIVGSPEVIVKACTYVNETAKKTLTELLMLGLRVVAVAVKKINYEKLASIKSDDKQLEAFKKLVTHDLQLLGFFGMEDSIRPEIAAIVQEARDAGLKIVMATGDHQKTALYVGKQVGIYKPGDDFIDGLTLEKLSDADLMKRLPNITVFSRVSPEHKMRIIELYHQKGEIVAMTGDGINDAPSLVAADLGIAMGGIGTEVAKQAADLILLDDSFTNIVHAIEQGRHIFYTLKRVVLYFFATNLGEVLIVLFAFVISLVTRKNIPLPITAAQILWLNLVTDGFLDVGLSMEPQEKGLLGAHWLRNKQNLIDWSLLGKALFMAMPMGIGGLYVFLHYYQSGVEHARTMTLLVLAMFQWFNAWNCRSATKSIFQIGFFANKWLILATVFVLSLQFVILYIPTMQNLFNTVPLSWHDWGVIIAISSPILFLEEIRKAFVRWYYKVG